MATVLSFIYYAFVSGITPGPANIASLSTAMRKGKDVAFRQWRGLFAGFGVIAISSAFITYLVGTAFKKYLSYFSIIGALYILYLAIHILLDDGEREEKEGKKLQEGTFLFGFFLQLSNVKIMIFCLTALTGYVLPYRSDLLSLLIVGLFLPFTGPICNLAWLFAGSKLEDLFTRYRSLMNIVMALSLLICAYTMVRF